jgi:hypothetical protein
MPCVWLECAAVKGDIVPQVRSSRYKEIVSPVRLTTAAALLLSASLTALPCQEQRAKTDQDALGLPFEIKLERKYDSIDKWYEITLVLPREYYSKKNLERIFRCYSDKEPELARIVRVEVFADQETYERSLSRDVPSPTNVTQAPHEEPTEKPPWRSYHAHYQRECLMEYDFYSPDLDNPSKHDTVILTGELYGAPVTYPCKIQDNRPRSPKHTS